MSGQQQQQQHVLALAIQQAQHLFSSAAAAAAADQDPFAPIPRLDDVNLNESPPLIYASLDQLTPSLTQRLHRLWHERGDFSKLKAASLNTATPSNTHTDAHDDDDDHHHFPSYGIPSPPLPPSSSSTASAAAAQNNALLATAEHDGPSSISLQDAESLKTDMLHRIGNAHFATYFLHNLLALLLQQQTNQRKLDQLQQAHQQQLEQAIPGSSKSSGSKTRAGTPLSEHDSTSAAAAAAAAAAHAEPYFDPTILGLSEVYRDPILQPAPPTQGHQNNDQDDDDDDENDKEEENLIRDGAQQSDSVPLHQTPLPALATTRATLSRASAILKRGSSSIRRVSKLPSEQTRWSSLAQLRTSSSASPSQTRPGPSTSSIAQPEASSSSSSNATTTAATWKLTPPPQNVGVGTAVWWAGLSAREDGEGAGAKDAWIGYGLPELQPRMRKNALAYFADDDDDHTQEAERAEKDVPEGKGKVKANSSRSPLVFVHRPRRRLRLELKGPKGQLYATGASTSAAYAQEGSSQNTQTGIEASLREAQEELVDEELWAELCAQVRDSPDIVLRISPLAAGPAVNATSGIHTAKPVSSSKTESMDVKLGGNWLLRLEMAAYKPSPTTSTGGASQADAADPDVDPRLSAFPRALLSFLRLSLIRSIRIRLKASAINAASNAAESKEAGFKTKNGHGGTSAGPQAQNKKVSNSNNNAGKSIIQLEREAAAANSKRGVGAYEVVSNPTTGSAASNAAKGAQTQQQKDGAVAAARAATLALQKERHLDPILGLFRYATFVSDIERILDDLIATSEAATSTESTSSDASEHERRTWYRLAPMASLVDSAEWMQTLLGGIHPPATTVNGATDDPPVPTFPQQQMEAVRMLSGVGTIFFDESPLILINFSYPARLTLQFCRRRNGPTATMESPQSPSPSSGSDARAAATPAEADKNRPAGTPITSSTQNGRASTSSGRQQARGPASPSAPFGSSRPVAPNTANQGPTTPSPTAGMWTGELSLRVFADFVGRELASVQGRSG
ncbi:hypothetical protein OC845_004916 [Tilletia horrida]|nr:hypothetical protein OC845_004916 [Tilletia horrida]